MSGPQRRGRTTALVLGFGSALLYLVAVVLVVGQLREPTLSPFEFWIEGTFSAPVILVIGLILIARRPEHRISQLFAGLVVAGSVQTASGAAATTLLHRGQVRPGAYFAAVHDVAQMALVVALILIVLLFPTGTLPSRRWRPVGCLVAGGAVVTIGAMVLRPGPLGNFPAVSNPLAVDIAVLAVLQSIGTWAVIAGFAGAVVAPLVRYRRARGPELQQLKWFAFAVVVGAVLLVGVGPVLPDSSPVSSILWTVAPTGVIAALGLAVLRYRLYDIDRVVSRSLAYAVVTIVLGGVYLTGIVGAGGLLRRLSGEAGGDLVVAASTLAVAALFQPLRRRVQAVVDRRFNRARYDARRTVEVLTQRLRDEVDLAALVGDLRGSAASALRPRHVSVWLASSGQTSQGGPR
jgi:hypothetical protein